MKNSVETEIITEKGDQEKTLLFTCPRCGSHELERVDTGVTAYSPVTVSADGWVTLGPTGYDFEDVDAGFYKCAHCPYQLEIDEDFIRDEDDLLEWLRNHNGDHRQPEQVE